MKYEELKNLSIDQLKEIYDKKANSAQGGLSFYREEIARRESEKLNSDMHSFTKTMKNLTWLIFALTILNVIIVLLQFTDQKKNIKEIPTVKKVSGKQN